MILILVWLPVATLPACFNIHISLSKSRVLGLGHELTETGRLHCNKAAEMKSRLLLPACQLPLAAATLTLQQPQDQTEKPLNLETVSRDCEGGFGRLPTSGGAAGLARLYPPSPLRQEGRRLQEPSAGCCPLQLPPAVLPPLSCSCSCAGGFSCTGCRVCAGRTAVAAASPAHQSCIFRT